MKTFLQYLSLAVLTCVISVSAWAGGVCQACNQCRYADGAVISQSCSNTCKQCKVTDAMRGRETTNVAPVTTPAPVSSTADTSAASKVIPQASAHVCQACNQCRYADGPMMSSECSNTCNQCHLSDAIMDRDTGASADGKAADGTVANSKKSKPNPHNTPEGCKICHSCMYSNNGNANSCIQQCKECQVDMPWHDVTDSIPTPKQHNYSSEQSAAMNQQFGGYQAQQQTAPAN